MAGGFSQEWLNKVRDANDIVDVISSYVNLTHKAPRYWGCCPFHHEKTPSFAVNPAKQMYYCFGCHEGGTVFTFIQKMERVSFAEAAKHLAERAGIPLEEVDNAEYIRQRARNERIYALNKKAAQFYFETLRTPEAKDAAQYLKRRGIDEATVVKFGLGFAPNSWDGLIKHLKGEFTNEELISAGLAISKNGRMMDMFRNRIIFPIINQYGRVIAFGGRVMDDSKPQYLNSPDTPVYNKKRNLFAMNLVKKLPTVDKVIVVEGYMDVIALHQQGYDYTLASLGTALTVEQVALIRRMTSDVYIAYDGDNAGQNATLKALETIRRGGAKAKVIALKDMDPDEFIKAKGKMAFDELMAQAGNEVDYKLSRIRNALDLTAAEGKKKYAIQAAPILRLIQDPVELDEYIAKLSYQTGFTKDVLYRQVTSGKDIVLPDKIEEKQVAESNKNDWHIIRLIQSSNRLFDYFVSKGGEELLTDEMCRAVYRFLADNRGDYPTDVQQILNEFAESAYSKDVNALFFGDHQYENPQQFLTDCIIAVKIDGLKAKRKELAQSLAGLDSNNIEQNLYLLKEIKDLDTLIANFENGKNI